MVRNVFRKIEIVKFAQRTRQLFIRLLAVVKWAKSAGKVDVCTVIDNIFFCDVITTVTTIYR